MKTFLPELFPAGPSISHQSSKTCRQNKEVLLIFPDTAIHNDCIFIYFLEKYMVINRTTLDKQDPRLSPL